MKKDLEKNKKPNILIQEVDDARLQHMTGGRMHVARSGATSGVPDSVGCFCACP